MRQIIYSAAASLDGFIARADGSVDWIPMDQDIDFDKMFRRFDTILMGRRTHEAALQVNGLLPGMDAYVYTRTKALGVRAGVEYVAGEPAELIRTLRRRPGKDLWLMGGGELAGEFLRADLLDGIQIALCPVLLGAGIRMFGDGEFPQRGFKLAGQRVYSRSGIAIMDYERQPEVAAESLV